MKSGWYENANYVVRTSGITKANGYHLFTEEMNEKYGCENYDEFCKLFSEAEKNDPEKHMQMIIDLGPDACEDSYSSCESPEMTDMLIKRRIKSEKNHELMGYVDHTPRGGFETLPHGRQVQIVYLNILIFAGLRKEMGLEKMSKRDIEDTRREAARGLVEASKKMAEAEKIEQRGRKMIATALTMQSRKAPHGRQRQQLRALGFVA